jgi:hypothetical protein
MQELTPESDSIRGVNKKNKKLTIFIQLY